MLQILEHEPMTSREVATILKTEQQSASTWLEELQNAGKIERKWLKQRSPYYPCYQAVSANERLSAEVAARKDLEKQVRDLEKQVRVEAIVRQNAELRAKNAEAAANRKAEDRIAVEVAALRMAERKARTAEEKARKEISIEAAAREKAEQRAIRAERRARSSPPTQRQSNRPPQSSRPNPSQNQENPSSSPASPSSAKNQSSPRQSNSGCLWLVTLPGQLGLLALLGNFFL